MKEKDPVYIASCSFGKDSIATILLAIENNVPLDYAVFSEVMYSNAEGISGEIPEHIEWIREIAIPKLEALGVPVKVVRAARDYCYYFTPGNENTKGNHVGKLKGFPLGGHCVINRDCKIKPIHDFYKSFGDRPIIQYVGIAKDEPVRLARLKDTGKRQQISLLQKYGYTEAMAKKKAAEYGLLSPLYSTSYRGGVLVLPELSPSYLRRLQESAPGAVGETSRTKPNAEPLLLRLQVRRNLPADRRKNERAGSAANII